jgi:hypothetical protein
MRGLRSRRSYHPLIVAKEPDRERCLVPIRNSPGLLRDNLGEQRPHPNPLPPQSYGMLRDPAGEGIQAPSP